MAKSTQATDQTTKVPKPRGRRKAAPEILPETLPDQPQEADADSDNAEDAGEDALRSLFGEDSASDAQDAPVLEQAQEAPAKAEEEQVSVPESRPASRESRIRDLENDLAKKGQWVMGRREEGNKLFFVTSAGQSGCLTLD